ncbi:MAG: glycoside hydrolase family 2 TIM barrel-domain containing protein [Alistipes sp.]
MIKQTILLAALIFGCIHTLEAQQKGRIYRTELIPYDTRLDADNRNRASAGHNIDYTPKALTLSEGEAWGAILDVPYVWIDGNIYLHLENVGSAYTLRINNEVVAEVEDSATPAEFAVTPYIRQGKNSVIVTPRRSRTEQLNAAPVARKAFENSYLYYQEKRSIRDFEIALVPDSTRRFGILELAIIAQNSFNYAEPVTVGYDIYSPAGKLLEFNMTELTIAGQSTDTVRFKPFIYGTYNYKWEAGGKALPPRYKVMLFTKRNGAYKEYMPLKIGFGKTELIDGRIMRLGKQITPVKASYNAAADRKTTLAQLKTLKASGKNTICPDYPQPAWFYDLCDELGLYVIDRANINAPEKHDDRSVGGTPSNDPTLVDDYVERVKAMYYRSRNFTCVIGYALGGDSGNGYTMYKAYEWLKGVEKTRPVIYEAADGEWNSDL